MVKTKPRQYNHIVSEHQHAQHFILINQSRTWNCNVLIQIIKIMGLYIFKICKIYVQRQSFSLVHDLSRNIDMVSFFRQKT